MKMISAFARGLILAVSLAASAAHADILFDTTGALSATDPTQLGRIFRNGIQQDWAGSEVFQGTTNTGTSYHYTTYVINVGLTPFIQIDFDSASPNTFISAYQTSYTPGAGLGVNWLGDEGASGNFFGIDPSFFNVRAALNGFLVIVVNGTSTGANSGVGDPFHLIVEGFLDANFTSTVAAVPEPSTLLLCFLPLVALLGREAWKRRGTGRQFPGALSL